MNDTVKLIIEIPKAMYENVQNGTYCGTLYKELKNGTPLDDIKAEIEEKSVWYRGQTYDGLCMALQIIDKYIGKAESEVKSNDNNKV